MCVRMAWNMAIPSVSRQKLAKQNSRISNVWLRGEYRGLRLRRVDRIIDVHNYNKQPGKP